MASKKTADKRMTQDLHVRLTDAEAAYLQKKADALGVTLSKVARVLIFKRNERAGEAAAKDGAVEASSLLVDLKASFKKLNKDVSMIVSGYEKSLSLKDGEGNPSVNTKYTINIMESVVFYLMGIQEKLNEVIRTIGGSEIHVAAKPQTGTAVGDHIASGNGRREEPDVKRTDTVITIEDNIPDRYKTMANITILGTLAAEPEQYKNGKYDMLRLVLTVKEYEGKEERTYNVDCTDFASRYANLLPHLTVNRKLLVAGDLRFGVKSYNDRKSDSAATVVISNVSFV